MAKENGCPWHSKSTILKKDICVCAAKSGKLEVLKWARENDCPWHDKFSQAMAGNLEMLKWANENGCPLNEFTFQEAAKQGKVEVLEWLREKKVPMGCRHNGLCRYQRVSEYRQVVERGRLSLGTDSVFMRSIQRPLGGVLMWLREAGCEWDGETTIQAAREGHLQVLKWARGQGCPWLDDLLNLSAQHGRLEVVKWAREQGCPGENLICEGAAEGGHIEVLKWAKASSSA